MSLKTILILVLLAALVGYVISLLAKQPQKRAAIGAVVFVAVVFVLGAVLNAGDKTRDFLSLDAKHTYTATCLGVIVVGIGLIVVLGILRLPRRRSTARR